jgi:hypothetical protein
VCLLQQFHMYYSNFWFMLPAYFNVKVRWRLLLWRYQNNGLDCMACNFIIPAPPPPTRLVTTVFIHKLFLRLQVN